MSKLRERTSEMQGSVLVVVSATGGVGGPSRSIMGLLEQFDGLFSRTLIAPPGHLARSVTTGGIVEELVVIPRARKFHVAGRVFSAVKIAYWLVRHRSRVLVVHANGEAELNLVGLGVLLSRVKLVVSARASEVRPWVRRLGPIWRRLLPGSQWVAVSDSSRQLVLSANLANANQVVVVPNPVDAADVRAYRSVPSQRLRIGYLGGKGFAKGFDLLPGVIRELGRTDVTWQLFTSQPADSAPEVQVATWDELEFLRAQGYDLQHFGKLADVREAYARCDIVFSPSRRESFGRIPVEAMANGIPVVASDIPTFVNFIDGFGCGLLFRSEDCSHAALQLDVLLKDGELRATMGRAGLRRAMDFEPGAIAQRFLAIYGVPLRSGSA